MNIVKQFDDHEFFERHHCLAYGDTELTKGYWRWGLGDDGELYCQCSYFNSKDNRGGYHVEWIDNPNEWYLYFEACHVRQYHVLFEDMLKIVKEFGKLLVWL
jgi:hypothetical protein